MTTGMVVGFIYSGLVYYERRVLLRRGNRESHDGYDREKSEERRKVTFALRPKVSATPRAQTSENQPVTPERLSHLRWWDVVMSEGLSFDRQRSFSSRIDLVRSG